MSWLDDLKKVPKRAYFYIISAIIIIAVLFNLFMEFAEDVLEKEKFIIDRYGSQFSEKIASPKLDQFFAFVTELGSVKFITICSVMLAVIMFFVYKRRIYRIFYFAIAMLGISVLTTSLKEFFERKRPNVFEQFDGTGYSFPSGHSTGSIVFFGFLIYLVIRSQKLNRALKWIISIILGILIILIGYSRVYLGVHYTTDVFAGQLLGLSWLITCLLILEYILLKKNK